MTHTLHKTFLAAILSMFAVLANAHDFEVDGIYYNITSSTKLTLQVTYKGGSYSSYSGEYTGEVIIPTSVEYEGSTYTVTSIGDYAFEDCTGMTSVTIPSSVTSIGKNAFSTCNRLTSVTIPGSVTSIGDYTFYNCTGLTSVSIPSSVTSIGSYVFYGCKALTSVDISNSVASIGSYAFAYCTGLTSVDIPESVTSIGDNGKQQPIQRKDGEERRVLHPVPRHRAGGERI